MKLIFIKDWPYGVNPSRKGDIIKEGILFTRNDICYYTWENHNLAYTEEYLIPLSEYREQRINLILNE